MPSLTVLISSTTESVHNSNVTQYDVDLSRVRRGLRESTEREWKPRINLEVQRVQRAAPANQRCIIHYFCAVNPRVFCCLRKTKLHSGAVLRNRVARRACGKDGACAIFIVSHIYNIIIPSIANTCSVFLFNRLVLSCPYFYFCIHSKLIYLREEH